MKILPAFMALSAIALAACGTTGAASTATSSATPTPGGRGFGGGTAGQLVKLNGQTLTLSTSTGDVQVVYTTSTTITQTSTVSAADIASGLCVVITGTKDSSGAVTARSVRLSQPVNGTCSQGPGGFGGGRPPGGALPSGAPRPSLNPNAAIVSGLVTAVSGVSVTVNSQATSATTTVTVPTTVTVSQSAAGTAADLTIDSCVVARGQKNTQGVVQATSLNITPTNSSGKCSTGGGRFPGGFSGTPPANPGGGASA
jgi:hypothetical protein